jgi:hypothetical protein
LRYWSIKIYDTEKKDFGLSETTEKKDKEKSVSTEARAGKKNLYCSRNFWKASVSGFGELEAKISTGQTTWNSERSLVLFQFNGRPEKYWLKTEANSFFFYKKMVLFLIFSSIQFTNTLLL